MVALAPRAAGHADRTAAPLAVSPPAARLLRCVVFGVTLCTVRYAYLYIWRIRAMRSTHAFRDDWMRQMGRDLPDDCWLWPWAKDREGYGFTREAGRQLRAHRWSYARFVGPIPLGLTIDHLCRCPSCVNPKHLEPVTIAENTRRGRSGEGNRNKAHCPHGHAYTPENTRLGRQGRQRFCRACDRARPPRGHNRRHPEQMTALA
jgi:hypothetical protein